MDKAYNNEGCLLFIHEDMSLYSYGGLGKDLNSYFANPNQSKNLTHKPTQMHTLKQHTHKVYLFCIVLVTLLNSWPLTGAWGWLCVGGLQTSAAQPPPPSPPAPLSLCCAA